MRISFIHRFGEQFASYRYRAKIPAREMGAVLNDLTADVVIFSKPRPEEVDEMRKLNPFQKKIVDVCDDWIGTSHYQQMMGMADAITCSTEELRIRLSMFGFDSTVILDPYEFDLTGPHCHGDNLLWFGHAVNFHGVQRSWKEFSGYPLRIVSNLPGTIRWSIEILLEELARADIVVMPETLAYKSCNRVIEAIRRGCFVVAENHVSLRDIPGIWIGGLKEGIEWASKHQEEANEWIRKAQRYTSEKYSPNLCGTAWKKICEKVSACISDAGLSTGTDG